MPPKRQYFHERLQRKRKHLVPCGENDSDISSSDLVEIKGTLLNEGELGSLEIKQVANKEDGQTVEDAKTILLDENLMFEEYIETVNIGELDRDHLLETGKKICLERGETDLL